MQSPRMRGENTPKTLETASLTVLMFEIITKNRIEARITARAFRYF